MSVGLAFTSNPLWVHIDSCTVFCLHTFQYKFLSLKFFFKTIATLSYDKAQLHQYLTDRLERQCGVPLQNGSWITTQYAVLCWSGLSVAVSVLNKLLEMWGSHHHEDVAVGLVGCNAMLICRYNQWSNGTYSLHLQGWRQIGYCWLTCESKHHL
jgi:hypothetical protein